MPRYDFTTPRLFVPEDLAENAIIPMDRRQANYLLNVLRLQEKDGVLLFNGRDGEWHSIVQPEGRKKAHLLVEKRTRQQTKTPNLTLLFAPLKQARLEYMVQKAVEMGAGHLIPVRTQYTQAKPLRDEKASAYIIEAAEQCGIITLPTMSDEMSLHAALETLAQDTHIIFCDEGEQTQNPLDALEDLSAATNTATLAVLIGPEGGFSESEREMLRSRKNVIPIPLGPRVLRADTAAVAAMAVIQAKLGDWR